MWEFQGMMGEHAKMMRRASGKPDPVTDAEFEEMKEAIRRMNLPDVKI